MNVNDAKRIAKMRERYARCSAKGMDRMTFSIDDMQFLTAVAGVPLYRGRNTTYISLDLWHINVWLHKAEQHLAQAVASKFDRT